MLAIVCKLVYIGFIFRSPDSHLWVTKLAMIKIAKKKSIN